jgi:serine/threonine protein kinase
MPSPEVRRGFLLHLAAEGMIPVLGGCAGALAGGPEIGLVGVAVGQVVEKAINFFGARIVQRWCEWFRAQPPEVRQAALAELAALTPEEAREEAAAALDRLAPDASPEDRSVALEYLSIIPGALDRALPRSTGGQRSLAPTVTFDEPQLLLQLLPADRPPYPVPSDLPGTPYRLLQLLGSGGFGAVYRATTHSLQHLPLAVKFCLDPTLAAALHRERSNLERLMKAGGEGWSTRIVRLYGYDLEHRTPYLVYEFVPGGDLTHDLKRRVAQLGRALNADEVLGLMIQVCEALAFAHKHGLVHRDLKPTNVLVDGETLKLADFGLGSLAAARAAQVSRIGATTIEFLSLAEQASLFRGAGTPLYMAPEQRRGAAPDPRHDLYSLGVMWFQLLAGDVSRELHPGWAKELAVRFQVPREHLGLIERCVGWLDERPRDAAELLPLLRGLQTGQAPPPPVILAEAVVTPPPPLQAQAAFVDRVRQGLMQSLVKRVEEGHRLLELLERKKYRPLVGTVLLGVLLLTALFMMFGTAWLVVAVGVPLIGGLGALLWHLHESQVKAVQQQIQQAMRTLGEEFPDAVQSWGGSPALRNPDTVREIVRSLPPLGRPAAPASPPGPVPRDEQDRREELAAGLRQVAQGHTDLARFAQRKPLPLPAALLLSLFWLGLPLGLTAAFCYYLHFGPGEYSGGLYSHRGDDLSAANYSVQTHQHIAVAAALGGGLLLVLTAAGTWRLSRRPLYGGRAALAVAASLLLAMPAGAIAGGLWFAYFGPIYPGGGYPSHDQVGAFDYRGVPISATDYWLFTRKVQSEAIAVGVAVCVLLTALSAWLYLRGYGRRHAEARRRLAGHVHELAAAFPVTVENWGGTKALENRETVQDLLGRIEPAGYGGAGAR